ncbi:MAG: Fic family protein [Dehalococcoidia bacterium]|nr:Fic family protein [Dehalococcoidia bacterium]
MSRLRYLARSDIDDIASALADLFPDGTAFRVAGARGASLLESALAQPRWPQYRTAQAKAAALHYSLNKNHAFIDGNSEWRSPRWSGSCSATASSSTPRTTRWSRSRSPSP